MLPPDYAPTRHYMDTVPSPPPDFELFEDDEDTLSPPPISPTMPSPSMEEYTEQPVSVETELPLGEVLEVVPEQVFSEFLTHNAPEGEHQMVTLSVGDYTVGAYSVTNIPGRSVPQIRKMTNVHPMSYSIDQFMQWLEEHQPTTWWKAKQVMKKYQ